MKRLTAAFLTLALLFSLGACGKKKNTNLPPEVRDEAVTYVGDGFKSTLAVLVREKLSASDSGDYASAEVNITVKDKVEGSCQFTAEVVKPDGSTESFKCEAAESDGSWSITEMK